MHEVDKELGCVGLRQSTTVEAVHSAFAVAKLNTRTQLNVGDWFRVEPFSTSRGVVDVVYGSCRVPPLSTALPGPYHRFCINRFYRDHFLRLKSTLSGE